MPPQGPDVMTANKSEVYLGTPSGKFTVSLKRLVTTTCLVSPERDIMWWWTYADLEMGCYFSPFSCHDWRLSLEIWTWCLLPSSGVSSSSLVCRQLQQWEDTNNTDQCLMELIWIYSASCEYNQYVAHCSDILISRMITAIRAAKSFINIIQ